MLDSIALMTKHKPRYTMKRLTLIEQIQNYIELLTEGQLEKVKFVVVLEDKGIEVASNCSAAEQTELLAKVEFK